MMRKEDWDKLCRNIYEKKCILLLGSEFPLEFADGGHATSFASILSAKLKDELQYFDRLPAFVSNNLNERDLSQLACDYINYKGADKKIARFDLESMLADHLSEMENNIKSDFFLKLASLPFNFIVNTNYTQFFSDQLSLAKKDAESTYYNFRGNKIDLVDSVSADQLGTELSPFIFNLFGSVENPASLVISENDLVQFVINIISKNPGLPANVKSELANQENCFLFLGFGFLAKSWYFRILLQALESNNKGRMSYALESIDSIKNDQDPTVLFFRDELKVSLCHIEQKEFIETLVTNYKTYIEKRKEGAVDKNFNENAPKVFISYKSEDAQLVNEICVRLKKQGLNVWIDRERLQGKWVDSIANEIANSDAFVLMQSQQIKNNPVTYVNVEIKKALDKAAYYGSEADFIFPVYIDNNTSVITEYPKLLEINSYDLTVSDKIDQLAKDIKRSYERNKRKPAA